MHDDEPVQSFVFDAYPWLSTEFATYDNRNRLTQLNRAGAETTYTYDANSNRLSAIDKTTSDTDLDGEFDDSDFSKSTGQALNIDPASNKLLGFTQTFTKVRGTRTLSILNTNVAYTLDANGALSSDGLRDFEYDEANRLSKVKIFKDGEAAKVRYLHNALGQRVFKSEPEAEQTLPNEAELGLDFITWLKSNFKWLFANAQANTSIGTAYSYADGQLPTWALMGEYDNGSAAGKGRTEYIWLPTEDGQAIPVGIFRNGKFFAIHTDHLGTPRLMTNEDNKRVWQWPYSAFGNNKPTGVLKATPNPKAALTNQPTLLKATAATEMNLRFPGQYADEETGLFYNYYRNYLASQGRYTQNDPIGLGGGWNRVGYVGGNALGAVDPEGLLAQAAALACGPYYVFCACAITAATWGVYSSSSEDRTMHSDANRRQRQYEAAKSRSCVPNPDPKATCSEISKTIDTLQNAINRYKFFDAEYTPGRHDQKLEDLQNRVDALKERYKNECTDCK